MSGSPLQTFPVPNKLRLDLYTGVLVLTLSKSLHVRTVVCSFVRPGTADAALSFDFMYHVR